MIGSATCLEQSSAWCCKSRAILLIFRAVNLGVDYGSFSNEAKSKDDVFDFCRQLEECRLWLKITRG